MSSSGRARVPVTRAFVLVTGACLAGCGSLAPDAPAAADAAQRFHDAVSGGDGAAACALLVPAAVEELEQSAGAPCEEAVLAEDLPEASGTLRTDAWGRQAQVALDGDTVFLTVSGDAWLVTGAGCTSRPERPYDCQISAG